MIKLLLVPPILSLGFLAAAAAAAAEMPPLTAWIWPLVVISLLIVLNGLYVAAEFAIIGTRPSQMEALAEEGDKTARRIHHIIENPRRIDQYIATAQLGITIASLGLGMYAEPAVAHLIEPYLTAWFGIENPDTVHTITYFLVLGVLTYLHVVVGEMVPKAIALSNPGSAAMQLNQPMWVSQKVLTPLVFTLNSIGNWLLKLLRLPPATPRPHSPAEIEQIVSESTESGLLNLEEQEIIRNIFDFSDRRVGQVMTPRPRVQGIPLDMPMEELLPTVGKSIHTRFPVFDGSRDRIVGIVHLRDLAEFLLNDEEPFDLRKIMTPAPVVPADDLVEDLLAMFRRDHIHMAIVLDEVGGMAGVVTLEDLIEEVVGEVRDEFDIEHEPLVELDEGVLDVSGTFLLTTLQEMKVLPPAAPDLPDVDTVGGLITTLLGRPPLVGDACEFGPVKFFVTEVVGLAVVRARIEFESGTAEHERRSGADGYAGK